MVPTRGGGISRPPCPAFGAAAAPGAPRGASARRPPRPRRPGSVRRFSSGAVISFIVLLSVGNLRAVLSSGASGPSLGDGPRQGAAIPVPPNSIQLRLKKLFVGPPGAGRNTTNSSWSPPGSVRGTVVLAYVVAPAVAGTVTAVSRGPSTASRWTSAMPVPPDVRSVSESMLVRLKGPLSWSQSPLPSEPRCSPPPDVGGRRRVGADLLDDELHLLTTLADLHLVGGGQGRDARRRRGRCTSR